MIKFFLKLGKLVKPIIDTGREFQKEKEIRNVTYNVAVVFLGNGLSTKLMCKKFRQMVFQTKQGMFVILPQK